MERFLKVAGLVIIVLGIYMGVRYLSTMIHYGCLNPAEDCPPPFLGLAEIGYYATGGSLVPFYESTFKHLQTIKK